MKIIFIKKICRLLMNLSFWLVVAGLLTRAFYQLPYLNTAIWISGAFMVVSVVVLLVIEQFWAKKCLKCKSSDVFIFTNEDGKFKTCNSCNNTERLNDGYTN
jgi:hypothetical protein